MNLVCIKNYKKAFSLVEISIVLCIIALLAVFPLQLFKLRERSKMISIIREFELIKNDVLAFYSIFGDYPGNLTQSKCESQSLLNNKFFKNSNTLKMCDSGTALNGYDYNNQTIINGYGMTSFSCEDCETIAGSTDLIGTRVANIYAMRMLYFFDQGLKIKDTTSLYTDKGYVDFNEVDLFFIKSNNVDNSFWTFNKDENFRGGRNEIKILDSEIYNKFFNKSHISIFYNIPSDSKCNLDGSNCTPLGSLSPSMAYEIDNKIDDGKPYTGYVVAFKNSYAQNNGSITATELSQNCTTLNKTLTDLSISSISSEDLKNAKYSALSPNFKSFYNRQYGCNMSFSINR